MTRCPHLQTEARHKPTRFTVGQEALVQRQCVKCGRAVGSSIPLRAFPLSIQELFSRWEEVKRPGKRKKAYRDFLQSPEWKAQRQRVLERDHFLCAGLGCREPATQAHHLSYFDPIESTPDELIVASCRRCNLNEREQRIGAG